MVRMETWFGRLPADRQRLLNGDRWALARAAWDGALEEAKTSMMAKADQAHARGDYAERDRLRSAAGALQADQGSR